ncbi:MAG: hypothetical protein L7S46_05535 [Candidatus Poseidoniaceae archaeon]|jgi:hypothetical protein|nr:hypothetical protein [Candidatus Poseidoniaceae archaeon]
MRTCVDTLIALAHVDGPSVRNEAQFIADRLDVLRQTGQISNDAYLDAGAIQGAFNMIGNLVEMGVPQKEIFSQLKEQLNRACRLEEKHPGLDSAVESGRAS